MNSTHFAILYALAAPQLVADVDLATAQHHQTRVIVASVANEPRHYLAFPDLVDLGDEVLVSFKRGQAHGGDPGAEIDTVRIDKLTDAVTPGPVTARLHGMIMQMGEWVRFPNGDIGSYVDAQEKQSETTRIGMRYTRSSDGGKTYGPLARVGLIDGVEYGYPFEFVVEGTTTWMLAMSFSNLAGGYSVHAPRPKAGQVAILRSEDSGRNWKFVRNLSREFGDLPINESSFVRYADGFLVATRGYDNHARLHFTTNDFKLRRQVDLTGTHDYIKGYIGRPRLFMRDGRYYLMGRNWTEHVTLVSSATPLGGGPTFPASMKLCLFRLDPVALTVEKAVILDNAERANVTDGYYPVPYFLERSGRTLFRIVDYKGVDRLPPQIMEFEFLWEEVR